MTNGQEGYGAPVSMTPGSIIKAKALLATNRTISINVSILEELADEHDLAMAKLREALPAECKRYVDLADYFSESRFELLRTRMIKTANDSRREIIETVDGLGIK